MKNWIKYLLLTLFPLLLVASGKVYPVSSTHDFFVKNSIQNHNPLNGFFSLQKTIELKDILIEIDEEDDNFSINFSDSTVSSFSFTASKLYDISLEWKKVQLNNLHLLTLQDKVFILYRNLRI